eukprot:tig00021257_g19750.t1
MSSSCGDAPTFQASFLRELDSGLRERVQKAYDISEDYANILLDEGAAIAKRTCLSEMVERAACVASEDPFGTSSSLYDEGEVKCAQDRDFVKANNCKPTPLYAEEPTAAEAAAELEHACAYAYYEADHLARDDFEFAEELAQAEATAFEF